MKIVERIDCPKSRWFKSKQIKYVTDNGVNLVWDYIERTNSNTSIIIIPRFKISGDLLLVRQYRIIFEKYVIGFPAGLVDQGESIEKGALRELREETGYSGKIVSVSSMLSVHSALVHEMAYCAFIELDEDTLPVEQSLEDSENIEVFRVKEGKLFSFFDKASKQGDIISAGPWLVALTANWPKHSVDV